MVRGDRWIVFDVVWDNRHGRHALHPVCHDGWLETGGMARPPRAAGQLGGLRGAGAMAAPREVTLVLQLRFDFGPEFPTVTLAAASASATEAARTVDGLFSCSRCACVSISGQRRRASSSKRFYGHV